MRLIGSILVSFLATAALSAEVYRWTDEQGNVTYSDRPLSSRAEIVSVAITGASTTTSAPAVSADAAPAQPQAEPEPAAPPGPADASPEVRARNCEIAQERAQRFSASNRLFRELPDGGRQYLTDAEIDEARAQAAANVELWCD